MKYWLVTADNTFYDIGGQYLIGVFSTRDKAEAAGHKHAEGFVKDNYYSFEVSEIEIDEYLA